MFVVVEVPALQFPDWVVLDDHGEERERTPYFSNAILFAKKLTFEAQQAAEAALHLENTAGERELSFVSEAYRRGQASAYHHCAMRLSFLMGGTLPRGSAEFRQQLAELLTSMERWDKEAVDLANHIVLRRQPAR